MRRAEREVTRLEDILSIMDRCGTVSVAFGGDTPYVIPMNFGYDCEDGRVKLYLHGAAEGEKMARMARDPRAAFTMVAKAQTIGGATACAYSALYESVCGSGVLSRLEGEQKRRGLTRLMAQIDPGRRFVFEEASVEAVTVLCLEVERISGKRHIR